MSEVQGRVFSPKSSLVLAQQIVKQAGRELTDPEVEKVAVVVSLVVKTFHSDDGVAYQELDSIENEQLYTEDDGVEIFIRADSGGTRQNKSDLLFSLLTANWDDAGEEMFPKRLAEDPVYFDNHLTPADPALWELDRFEDFISERKKLIRQKFDSLLAPATRPPAVVPPANG